MKNLSELNNIQIKTKLISFIHNYYRIFDDYGRLIGYTKAKGFKLKEDIRIYTDENMHDELFMIKADRIIDISANYVVTDSKTGDVIGIISRQGFKSFLRDSWVIKDPDQRIVYQIKEDNIVLAMVRRTLTNLIPAKYLLLEDGQESGCIFKQNFNPFLLHFTANLANWNPQLDKRLAIASIILLLNIEGRQSN